MKVNIRNVPVMTLFDHSRDSDKLLAVILMAYTPYRVRNPMRTILPEKWIRIKLSLIKTNSNLKKKRIRRLKIETIQC